MEQVISAILWFALGVVSTILFFVKLTAYYAHTDPNYRKKLSDSISKKGGIMDDIEGFFYDDKK